MKKYLVAAVIVFAMGVGLRAEDNLDVPSSKVSNPIGADYGGINVATSAFSAAVSTVVPFGVAVSTSFRTPQKDKHRIYGANFSTGACGDRIDVYFSTSTYGDAGAPAKLVDKIYNVGNSTGAAFSGVGNTCYGEVAYRWPRRIEGNLFFKPSTAEYNLIQLLYWKEPETSR